MDLFNNDFKVSAETELMNKIEKHKQEGLNLARKMELLQSTREQLAKMMKRVEEKLNSIKNTPTNFVNELQELEISVQRYDDLLTEIQEHSAKVMKGAGISTLGGVALGGATAAFGGSALTAIAMSIGTASTGAAIGGLSGVAATNAALAWLGGGAIAAGGAGIAGGEALIALMGPIGWGIGGAIALGSGLWASGKNKEAAHDMLDQAEGVHAETVALKALQTEVMRHRDAIYAATRDLQARTNDLRKIGKDYATFTDDDLNLIGTIFNNTKTAGVLLNATLNTNQKFA